MNATTHRTRGRAVVAGMLIACALALLATSAGAAPLKPAKRWLSVWNNAQGSPNAATFTSGRLFNPADPADPVAPSAHVTVTYFQYGCWGMVAAQATQTIPPGQHGSFSTLLAAYPDKLYGWGCLAIASDVPIVPVNGRLLENVVNPGDGNTTEWAYRTEFWRAGKAGSTAWVSHFEHSEALGGPQYGGRFTGGWILNPARQKPGTALLPPAHVTVRLFNGACGAGTLWRQDEIELGPGQLGSFDSMPTGGSTLGQGCVLITSDLPVVAFNGAMYAVATSARSTTAITFQPVQWAPAP